MMGAQLPSRPAHPHKLRQLGALAGQLILVRHEPEDNEYRVQG